MSDVLLLDELATASGRRFGLATLNAPAALNALSLEMVRALLPALRAWAADANIAGVVLQGAGEKAFCAGGELRELYQSIRAYGSAPNPYAASFFGEEYTLDYAIHTYPKPLVCWGHGIVMGGGIGLMAGASHRVVTEKSRLAMPEINIGLYPDVGGSAILRRMPGRVGLFLALTGASLNAADAQFCGLADFSVRADSRDEVLAAIRAALWSDDATANKKQLSQLLSRYVSSVSLESKALQHFDIINALVAGDDLRVIDTRLRLFTSDDAWLATAAATYAKGSPTSAALAFALWQRVPPLSLADVFRLEYQVSLGCCAHADFVEGIRALLIEKDRRPRWQPPALADVTPALVEDHFRLRFTGPHPLAALAGGT
ncbi:MAG TPA: enoyl-CoA hydratase/isomerase family protein [Polyangia bacterium]|nr:enoyl-CoA hydratase/isomerase family protein [Polyangia bacterium]